MFPEVTLDRARALLDRCRDAGLLLATAESCTGGLVSACLTSLPGSSDVVDRGFVTYSDAAKAEMLGVPPDLIRARGAVSAEVAAAMAMGVLAATRCHLAVSVTGIAGPGGATATKPVGLVHFAASRRGGAALERRHVLPGGRDAVRMASVDIALALLLDLAVRPDAPASQS